MILAADIGNSHILLGVFNNRELVFTELLSTNRTSTVLEYGILFETALTVHGLSSGSIDGAIITSVVPSVTGTVKTAIERFLHTIPLTVGPGVKTGLKIKTDNPAQLGGDLVVSAVAAIKEYKLPLINIYMGTATAFSLIDKDKNFLGTSIGPGVGIAAEALVNRTSQLPSVAIDMPHKVIGTNTTDSVQSGLVFQTASMVDGMIDRIEEECGSKCNIVITGRYATIINGLCKHKMIYDPDLILKGMIEVYYKNAGK